MRERNEGSTLLHNRCNKNIVQPLPRVCAAEQFLLTLFEKSSPNCAAFALFAADGRAPTSARRPAARCCSRALEIMKIRTIMILLFGACLPALFGCSQSTQQEAEFKDLTKAVQAYCNTPASQRTPEARRDVLERLNAFEAGLASVPAGARLRYRDKVANQRCFVEIAR